MSFGAAVRQHTFAHHNSLTSWFPRPPPHQRQPSTMQTHAARQQGGAAALRSCRSHFLATLPPPQCCPCTASHPMQHSFSKVISPPGKDQLLGLSSASWR